MQVNYDTFCSAPWFQIRNDQTGQYRPCCELQLQQSKFDGQRNFYWPAHTPDQYLNSDYIKYLRENLTQGNHLPECGNCWQKEKMRIRSLRQILNNTVTNNQGGKMEDTWVKIYFDRKSNWQHDVLVSADVKVSNLCNFSCAMCNANDSSKIYTIWQQNRKNPLAQNLFPKDDEYFNNIRKKYADNKNYALLKELIEQRPKHLKILGGEPLMDKDLLELLLTIPVHTSSKISLLFVTNGSHDLCEFAQRLSAYRQVNYVVSLDGTHNRQDFIRRGSDWKYIESNIDKWNKHNRSIDVHCTLQSLNLFHLPDLVSWCESKSLALTIGQVQNPSYLTIQAIPEELRLRIHDRLVSMTNIAVSSDDQTMDFVNLKDLLDKQPFEPALLDKMRSFIKWYDPEANWRECFPEWQGILD